MPLSSTIVAGIGKIAEILCSGQVNPWPNEVGELNALLHNPTIPLHQQNPVPGKGNPFALLSVPLLKVP
ncbi:hypothetical protein RND71_009763 [Anisodus tanguticus]|uniref:Uncharacterized protein n=1 Tax=Anisodus tanguticus TaxID=243964 RepID=A0AAE1SG04_9SOLA|nr:hypothetical protein RND71_009763 [Anisodus tanguticus]